MIAVWVVAGVVTLVAIIFIFIAIRSNRFMSNFNTDAETLLASQTAEKGVITENDLNGLPGPVQRYLRFTGVIGKETVSTVRLKYAGAMRLSPKGPWKSLKATEYYRVSEPGFIWLGKASMMPAVSISARDSYIHGHGRMLIKIQSALTLGDSKGFEMDYSGLVRYLNEMTWFPMAFLKENIEWEAIDNSSARVTITDRGMNASAILYFDERGAVMNFIGERYRESNGKIVKDTWTTPIVEYSHFNGMMLPSKGKATWKLDSGDFCYFQAELTEIEYNIAQLYKN